MTVQAASLDTASRWPTPGVWPADQLAQPDLPGVGTGHAALDAVLPGGGWPPGALTELLLQPRQWPEWRLLLPALRTVAQRGRIVLVAPPATPNLQALAAQGLPPEALCCVQAPAPHDRQWATEQALRCTQVAAVVLWLHTSPTAPLRRLHLAAQAALRETAPLLWVCRPQDCRASPSPAPLRLTVHSLGLAGLEVDVFKRRGPPMPAPVQLVAPLPRLALLPSAHLHRAAPTHAPAPSARILPFPVNHARPVDRPDLAA